MSNEIVLGIKLKADGSGFIGEVKVAREELDKLGKAAGAAGSEAAKLNRETGNLSSQMGSLASAAKAAATGFAAMKLYEYAKDCALLNARYETLGISMYQAGKNAGYMRSEMDAYQAALEKTGISMTESRNTLTQMAAANMDLANATKLARAAQDLAVVGNTNSSEAFNRLIYGIKSGQTEVLRTLGINVSFEESYKRLGAELHKNANALTENEKMQARTNATMEAAAKYQGIYEEAMGTAGKQLTSLARYQENYKVIIGETFNESLAAAVGAYTRHLKESNAAARELKEKGDLKEWGARCSFNARRAGGQREDGVQYFGRDGHDGRAPHGDRRDPGQPVRQRRAEIEGFAGRPEKTASRVYCGHGRQPEDVRCGE